jgi:TPP-dependent pyruvate/acetoin dehydrogenase alpha subunit
MDQEVLAKWKARDPIDILRGKIQNAENVKRIEEQVDLELVKAVEFAINSPEPSVDEFLASIPDY